MNLTVHNRDILEANTDALVSPTGKELKMTSLIAEQIRHQSSGPIQSDLRKYDTIDGGDVGVTPGYNLSQYIIHTVTTPSQNTRGQNVRTATERALEMADDLACETIAVPVLGTGSGGLSFQAGVKIIGETVDAYQADHLAEVRIFCRHQEKYATAEALCTDQDSPWVDRPT